MKIGKPIWPAGKCLWHDGILERLGIPTESNYVDADTLFTLQDFVKRHDKYLYDSECVDKDFLKDRSDGDIIFVTKCEFYNA